MRKEFAFLWLVVKYIRLLTYQKLLNKVIQNDQRETSCVNCQSWNEWVWRQTPVIRKVLATSLAISISIKSISNTYMEKILLCHAIKITKWSLSSYLSSLPSTLDHYYHAVKIIKRFYFYPPSTAFLPHLFSEFNWKFYEY